MRSELEHVAKNFGFDAVGVTTPAAIGKAATRLQTFLELGRHGEMVWLAANAERRADPRLLWPDVRSIIMLARTYDAGADPLAVLQRPRAASISCYAHGADYHAGIKADLIKVARWLAGKTGAEAKVFVDTAPVMEKPLAAAAGLGWQGKHTNLVSRQHGSWTFLGAIFTTAELAPDQAEADHCGSCRRCLDICPTNAFPAPYQLDARRCIAYLTIEHKGHIARELREPIGNRVFGCDDCLAVCPWNKFASAARVIANETAEEHRDPPLAELLALDDAAFRLRYRGTAVKRTGRDRFVRNVLIAAGNSGAPELLPAIEPLLNDPSPLVRAMAVWALYKLCSPADPDELRQRHLPAETDPAVRAEWLIAQAMPETTA